MDRKSEAINVTVFGSVINILLTSFKLCAGIFGNSAAMIADGVHSLSDFATDIVVIISFRIANKPPDESHEYGHGKFETLASLIISVSLIAVGIGIGYEGIRTIFGFYGGKNIERPELIAVFAAAISIALKEFLYRLTVKVGKRINSQAVIANAWHHRSDAFSSISTLIGISGAIFLGEKFRILDPIAAIFVCVFIIKSGLKIFIDSLNQFLENSISNQEKEKILKILRNTKGFENPHNLKTRRIGNDISLEVHVDVPAQMSVVQSHTLADLAEKEIKKEFGQKTNVSIHIEPLNVR
jgi:cation diffusion facilitator family transporter